MDWHFDTLTEIDGRSLGPARLFATPRRPGPVVLFIHGGFHGAWSWAAYLKFLSAQGLSAAAIDLRGHGGLPQPADFCDMGLDAMSADVIAAAEELGGDVVLAGHSLGALIAMAAARTIAPRALLLLAPAAPGNVRKTHDLKPFPAADPVAPPPEARARKWFLQGLNGGDIAPYLNRLCPESPAFLNDGYGGSVTVDPAWVAGPILCISGGQDVSPFHPAGSDTAVAALYKATHITLDGAGHGFMLEPEWGESAAIIRDWLRAL